MKLTIEDIIVTTNYARSTPIENRFWSKVDKHGPDECWNWNGTVAKHGYGVFQIGQRKQHRAHRISFLLANGHIDSELLVMHKCDNPRCVNPKHLAQGTSADNRRDAVSKNRVARGEDGGHSNLTPADVLEIRSAYVPRKISGPKLGAIFGVSAASISNIVRRKTWSHI